MDSQPDILKEKSQQTPKNRETSAKDSDTRKKDWKEKWREKWKAMTPANKLMVIFTGIIALATVIYVFVSGFQLSALLESNRINRESLESVQRAFIGFRSFETQKHVENGKELWVFTPVVENSGATPATPSINYTGIDILPAPPDNQQFKGPRTKFPAWSIGAKATQALGPVSKDETFFFGHTLSKTMSTAPMAKPGIVIWGWVVYRDIFPRTKPHLTEFCMVLGSMGLAPDHQTLLFGWQGCPTHNCTDEYCDDYQNIVKMIPAKVSSS